MNMKIGIMTWFHYRNYGTALQAVALSRVLKKLGYTPQMINYKPLGYCRTLPDYSFSALTKRILPKLKKSNNDVPQFLCSDKKHSLFDDFLAANIDFTSPCSTLADLSELNGKFDAFVCGSDQVWSPLAFDPRFYLDFVSTPSKKVSYAPSMGVEKIEDKYIKSQIKSLLADFEAISVREESVRQIIKELTDKNAAVTLDPTLLLDSREWSQFCGSETSQSEQYVLAYMLGCDESHWQMINDTAKRMNKKLEIIPVFDRDSSREGCITSDIGPREFLRLFENADYVCTDSFHGIIFSLIFHKPFTAFERFKKNDAKNQNSRVHCLLDAVKMRSRLLTNGNYASIADSAPDFESADKALAQLRKTSVEFLDSALREACGSAAMKPVHILQQNSLCCGCGACASVCPASAIDIRLDDKGFNSAAVNSSCIGCGKCRTVCPFESKLLSKKADESKLYSLKSNEKDVLMRSTSGGAAYSISRELINRGYKICGCCYDPATQAAKHIIINNPSQLHALQGSKYIQSDFATVLGEIKSDAAASYAIFGTPCQIAGARRALGDRENVIYIDLVCHGVPTYNLYYKYLSHIAETSDVDVSHAVVDFRYKPKGWRSIHLHAYDGENEYCCSKEADPFFRLFDTGVCYMSSCYECRWRVDSEADIRLADYWGPRFADDNTGVNMLICFTDKGLDTLRLLQAAKCAEIEPQPIFDYLEYQQSRNLPRPVFYDSILSSLAGEKKLNDIAEKYAFPFENRSKPINEYIKYVLKMMAYKE